MRVSAVLLAIVTSGALIAACNGGGKDDPQTGTIPRVGDFIPPDAEPTDVPTGPLWLDELATDGGTNVTSAGECLGFTLRTDDEHPLTPTTTLTLGALGTLESKFVKFINEHEIRVGEAATNFECMWTKPFGPTGTWDLTIDTGAATWTIEDAITMMPVKSFDLGTIMDVRKWTLTMVDEPDANVFERPYDVDVYRIYIADAIDPTSHVFSHTEFFSTGAPAVLPVMQFWDPDHSASFLGYGGNAVIFPMRYENYIVVRDEFGMGGPGATYELATIRKQGRETTPSDNCYDVPTLTPAAENRAYYAQYQRSSPEWRLKDDFDPASNDGCADTTYGLGIRAPGGDAVWKVTVPAGKSLRVTTYDDKINPVTYLVPIPSMLTGTSGCPRRPTNCVAAAGRYGGGNTDTMIYKNLGAADEEFFLIHDSATVTTNFESNSFLMNVELYDR